MALNTAACEGLFIFSVWRCLYGCKQVCAESGWLKKTEEKTQKTSV